MSRKGQILASLVERIKTVKSANGYDTDIQKVYSDEIPMGLSLDDYELPAVLVISGDDEYVHDVSGYVKVSWRVECQLIHKSTVGDSVMANFMRDINKAIFADSPTLKKADAWRKFDGKPSEMRMEKNVTDLNMIDSNRFYFTSYTIKYHSHLTDL